MYKNLIELFKENEGKGAVDIIANKRHIDM